MLDGRRGHTPEMGWTWLALGGAVALSLALASCGPDEARYCTAMGADPGVSVSYTGFPNGTVLTAQVCVAAVCRSSQPLRLGSGTTAFVVTGELRTTAAQPIQVTVRDAAHRVVAQNDALIVRPERVQPNGPDCDPTVYDAAVTVSPGHVVAGG
ncbi:hypothetical protein [Allobranchiibius sp. CTAmp26]|uniref:hypothetical protein n=1 Tax=Allobranchiibius sp. CTAmp26 TaxID=2815214 RepID=UPI001AA0D6CD|nr:hypothetical protein [Allobranchiibius sp. CTAmp26]MBO1756761.1 hypothetical protein [Allobranchiibius sp. CTAmp26]